MCRDQQHPLQVSSPIQHILQQSILLSHLIKTSFCLDSNYKKYIYFSLAIFQVKQLLLEKKFVTRFACEVGLTLTAASHRQSSLISQHWVKSHVRALHFILINVNTTPEQTLVQVSRRKGGGVLTVYMTEGSVIIFWVENLHPPYFFGSRDLLHTFLGHKPV